jgi:hypothetical protein
MTRDSCVLAEQREILQRGADDPIEIQGRPKLQGWSYRFGGS